MLHFLSHQPALRRRALHHNVRPGMTG
jgi:hypothetical protein